MKEKKREEKKSEDVENFSFFLFHLENENERVHN